MIFYAKYNEVIVGTVSLLKNEWYWIELSKMAVTTDVQGLGIGRKLMEHCMKAAKSKIIIYSNRRLTRHFFVWKNFLKCR
jgi:predicted N-acetyltransferase YhbS